jgi:hypothetical protein
MYSSTHRRHHRIQKTREEINFEHAEWRARMDADPLVIEPIGECGLSFRISGPSIGNFRDLVGPEEHHNYLVSIGQADRIIEPPQGILEHTRGAASRIVARVCEIIRG